MTQFMNKSFSVSMMSNRTEPVCEDCGKPDTIFTVSDKRRCRECEKKRKEEVCDSHKDFCRDCYKVMRCKVPMDKRNF